MHKILVIEDDKIMRENMAEILELSGYEVSMAKDGKEGVKKAKQMLPDLIVCDIKMPGLDGYGVLHILNKDSQLAGVPFIFITAKTERSDRRKGMEMGADDYITKPFEDTELLNAVETRLKKSDKLTKQTTKSYYEKHRIENENELFNALKIKSKKSRIETLKAREIIFRAGDYPHFLYFIEDGQVKTYHHNEDGKEFISNIYEKGDLFGYQPLFEKRVYQQNAETTELSILHKIPKEDLFDLIGHNKTAADLFIGLISKNLTQKEEDLSRMAYDSVRKRIAIKLLEISESSGDEISISRTDLAALVGTTAETLVRTLSEFKEMGIIDVDGHNFTLANRKELMKIKSRF